jgi:hypothetical protein
MYRRLDSNLNQEKSHQLDAEFNGSREKIQNIGENSKRRAI